MPIRRSQNGLSLFQVFRKLDGQPNQRQARCLGKSSGPMQSPAGLRWAVPAAMTLLGELSATFSPSAN
jgi:hypothetical protein